MPGLSRAFRRCADADHRALRAEIVGAPYCEWVSNPPRAIDDKSVLVPARRQLDGYGPHAWCSRRIEPRSTLCPRVEISNQMDTAGARVHEDKAYELHCVAADWRKGGPGQV